MKYLHLNVPPTFNLALCFAVFSFFLQNGPFPGLLRSSSLSGFLQIPVQCMFFNATKTDPSPCFILICNIIGFSPVASHSSVLLLRPSYAHYSSQT